MDVLAEPCHVIVDCDNTFGLPRREVDDGLAILYLLGRSGVRLHGVTTVFGNGSLSQATLQSRLLLDRVGHREVPVVQGAAGPGEGLTPAVRFLLETSAAQPGRLAVLALGPLTNLAAAAREDPSFLGRLARIDCMGGYLGPLRLGWRAVAELNLSADPEAAALVLRAPCPVTLMSAQVCLQAPFGLTDMARLRTWPADLRRTVRGWLLAFGFLYTGTGVFYLWDLLPCVHLEHPRLFEPRAVELLSTVEDLASGSLRVREAAGNATALNLPTRILDQSAFKAVLFEAWQRTAGAAGPPRHAPGSSPCHPCVPSPSRRRRTLPRRAAASKGFPRKALRAPGPTPRSAGSSV